MIKLVLLIAILNCCGSISAQPYFDAVTIRGTLSPDAGVWRRELSPNDYKHYLAGVSVPVLFKKDSSKLVFSALTERWEIKHHDINVLPKAFQSLVLPISYVKKVSEKWVVSGSLIPRWNGNAGDMFKNSFQAGAAVVATYKKSPSLDWRVGIYYNDEFFGPFVVPLVGLNWKMSRNDNLFGLLPQMLIYEHKVSNKFYYGVTYRMVNNSYRNGYGIQNLFPSFMRINEMQFLISSDTYLTKNIVFNVEAGHSLFRQIRIGIDENRKDYSSMEKVNDNFIIKAGILYRIRLR